MKQKRILTRRQKTLRRGVAVVLLLMVTALLGDYGFTPYHAIRMAEEIVDCGRTKLVKRLGPAPVRNTPWNRLYVSANERAVLFTSAEYHFSRGWEDADGGCVDCMDNSPVHGAIYKVTSTWTKGIDLDAPNAGYEFDEVWYLYGRVDDPRAVSLRGRIMASREWGGEPEEVWAEETCPQEEWLKWKGNDYFIFPLWRRNSTKMGNEAEGSLYYQIELLDAEGTILYENSDLGGTGTLMKKRKGDL